MNATSRPIQTRFRFASGCHSLRLATSINSQAHSPKGTLSGSLPLQPVVSRRFQILFHSPRRGSFHLSLTVLFRYRSSSVFSLGRWTSQLPAGLACPAVLRIPPSPFTHAYRTLTVFGRPSQIVQLQFPLTSRVLQPRCTRTTVWASPLSLATTRGIFSFPRAT